MNGAKFDIMITTIIQKLWQLTLQFKYEFFISWLNVLTTFCRQTFKRKYFSVEPLLTDTCIIQTLTSTTLVSVQKAFESMLKIQSHLKNQKLQSVKINRNHFFKEKHFKKQNHLPVQLCKLQLSVKVFVPGKSFPFHFGAGFEHARARVL